MKILNCTEFLPNCCKSFTFIGGPAGVERDVLSLFERFLRIQQSVTTMQAELQDLKSIFKLHFELGGEPITAESGDTMVYQSKRTFGYKLSEIKGVLEELGAFEKAVKVNNGFIDRLCNGLSLSDENRKILRDARKTLSETKNLQILKSNK